MHAGMLKVPGLMPPRCNMFDTPGVPHDFQLSSRLSPEEVQPFSPHSSCLEKQMSSSRTNTPIDL